MKIIEEADYDVTLTLRLTTHVWFAEAERDGPITASDAIENAIGRLPESVFNGFGGEFEIALPIDGEAVREQGPYMDPHYADSGMRDGDDPSDGRTTASAVYDHVETLPASPLHDCGVLMGLHTRPGQCPLTGKTLREQQSEDRKWHADLIRDEGGAE